MVILVFFLLDQNDRAYAKNCGSSEYYHNGSVAGSGGILGGGGSSCGVNNRSIGSGSLSSRSLGSGCLGGYGLLNGVKAGNLEVIKRNDVKRRGAGTGEIEARAEAYGSGGPFVSDDEIIVKLSAGIKIEDLKREGVVNNGELHVNGASNVSSRRDNGALVVAAPLGVVGNAGTAHSTALCVVGKESKITCKAVGGLRICDSGVCAADDSGRCLNVFKVSFNNVVLPSYVFVEKNESKGVGIGDIIRKIN